MTPGTASGQLDFSSREGRSPAITAVVPVFNEEESIAPFLSAIFEVVEANNLRLSVLFVDDGSSDDTVAAVRAAIAANDRVQLLGLSRNFGKEAALTAGLDHAGGDVVIPMDVDLQDPPELIPQFVAKWRLGYDVVHGRRSSRETDGWFKRFTALAFYRLFNGISSRPIPNNVGDFRLLDRRVVDSLAAYREKNRFMKGLFSIVGFRTTEVEYVRPLRHAGTSKWNYWRLWNFALDGIISFSTLPLRIWTYVGVGIATISFFYAAFIIANAVFGGSSVPGYPSLMAAILFMGGIQLISLGVIGEYVGRMFLETKNRPIYVVSAHFNMNSRPSDDDQQGTNGP